MTGARRVGAFCLTVMAALISLVGSAAAEPGPIELVSKSAVEQAPFAEHPAISADGSYVAFQGELDGMFGVFRKDLATGAVDVVSAGPVTTFPSTATAVEPSISADGRYVSFTTKAPLDPVDDTTPESSDVYVADMSTSPPTYELASALDGCVPGASPTPCGLQYSGLNSGETGSTATGGVSLSADGRRVAFVTTAVSNLTSEADGATPGVPTPGGQVVVRDLQTDQTTLVSEVRDPLTGLMEPGQPVPEGAILPNLQLATSRGAALSADGTTVAWLGAHLPAQVPLLPEEAVLIEREDDAHTLPYDEPLWRRIADGPSAPTRRITGGVGDPQAVSCPPDGTAANPACRGAFPEIFEKANSDREYASGWLGWPLDGVPSLSSDGREVALIGDPTKSAGANLFLVDMAEGLSRVEAVRRLTREVIPDPGNAASDVNLKEFIPQNGHIWGLAMSGDGTRIAFATARQRFPLSPPSLIGSPPSSLGLVELYLIDLEGETIQRLTHGTGGVDEPSLAKPSFGTTPTAEIGSGATSPSLDESGETIVFSSIAENLVEGDGNEESDVFAVKVPRLVDLPGSSTIPPRPRGFEAQARWRLGLSASSLPDGRVRVVAIVPAGGKIRVRASGKLRLGTKPRRFSHTQKAASRPGRVKLDLALSPSLRKRARLAGGLMATARVSFHSPLGKTLAGRLQVRFHVHRAKGRRAR
jgi:Tol biopolymer transport system component